MKRTRNEVTRRTTNVGKSSAGQDSGTAAESLSDRPEKEKDMQSTANTLIDASPGLSRNAIRSRQSESGKKLKMHSSNSPALRKTFKTVLNKLYRICNEYIYR